MLERRYINAGYQRHQQAQTTYEASTQQLTERIRDLETLVRELMDHMQAMVKMGLVLPPRALHGALHHLPTQIHRFW